MEILVQLENLLLKESAANIIRSKSPVRSRPGTLSRCQTTPLSPVTQQPIFRSFFVSALLDDIHVASTPVFLVKDTLKDPNRDQGRKGEYSLNIQHSLTIPLDNVGDKTKFSLTIVSLENSSGEKKKEKGKKKGKDGSGLDLPGRSSLLSRSRPPSPFGAQVSQRENSHIDQGEPPSPKGLQTEVLCGKVSTTISSLSSDTVQTHCLPLKIRKKKMFQAGAVKFSSQVSHRKFEISDPSAAPTKTQPTKPDLKSASEDFTPTTLSFAPPSSSGTPDRSSLFLGSLPQSPFSHSSQGPLSARSNKKKTLKLWDNDPLDFDGEPVPFQKKHLRGSFGSNLRLSVRGDRLRDRVGDDVISAEESSPGGTANHKSSKHSLKKILKNAPSTSRFAKKKKTNSLNPRLEILQKLIDCIDFLSHDECLCQEGLFRVSAPHPDVAKVEKIADEKNLSWEDRHSYGSNEGSYAIATLFIRYAMSLEPPLIPYDVYSGAMVSDQLEDQEQKRTFLSKLFTSVPPNSFEVLRRLFELVVKISRVDENKMDVKNLGIVFGPVLMHAEEERPAQMVVDAPIVCHFIEYLINNFEHFFEEDDSGKAEKIEKEKKEEEEKELEGDKGKKKEALNGDKKTTFEGGKGKIEGEFFSARKKYPKGRESSRKDKMKEEDILSWRNAVFGTPIPEDHSFQFITSDLSESFPSLPSGPSESTVTIISLTIPNAVEWDKLSFCVRVIFTNFLSSLATFSLAISSSSSLLSCDQVLTLKKGLDQLQTEIAKEMGEEIIERIRNRDSMRTKKKEKKKGSKEEGQKDKRTPKKKKTTDICSSPLSLPPLVPSSSTFTSLPIGQVALEQRKRRPSQKHVLPSNCKSARFTTSLPTAFLQEGQEEEQNLLGRSRRTPRGDSPSIMSLDEIRKQHSEGGSFGGRERSLTEKKAEKGPIKGLLGGVAKERTRQRSEGEFELGGVQAKKKIVFTLESIYLCILRIETEFYVLKKRRERGEKEEWGIGEKKRSGFSGVKEIGALLLEWEKTLCRIYCHCFEDQNQPILPSDVLLQSFFFSPSSPSSPSSSPPSPLSSNLSLGKSSSDPSLSSSFLDPNQNIQLTKAISARSSLLQSRIQSLSSKPKWGEHDKDFFDSLCVLLSLSESLAFCVKMWEDNQTSSLFSPSSQFEELLSLMDSSDVPRMSSLGQIENRRKKLKRRKVKEKGRERKRRENGEIQEGEEKKRRGSSLASEGTGQPPAIEEDPFLFLLSSLERYDKEMVRTESLVLVKRGAVLNLLGYQIDLLLKFG